MTLRKTDQADDLIGKVLPIRVIGDNVLRKKAEPVDELNDEVRKHIVNMVETMYVKDGVGLAAPQVGLSLRIFVIDPDWVKTGQQNPIVMINPRFLSMTEAEEGEEGCLSLPGIFTEVKRAAKVELEAYDLSGKLNKYTGEGFFARVVQHEYDHLDGVLFTDRVNKIKLFSLKKRIRELESKTNEQGENFDYYHAD
jgi:peptide deformylase